MKLRTGGGTNRQSGRTRAVASALFALAVALMVGLGYSAGDGAESADSEDASTSGTSAITTLDGVFAQTQLDRIAPTYERSCSSCHGNDLGGSGLAPPLTGLGFMFYWQGKSVAELYNYTHDNMPLDNPGSLTDQQYADLVALILEANGFPTGEAELMADVDQMAQIEIAAVPEGGE